MIRSACRFHAAFSLFALALTADAANVPAQAESIDVPTYRALQAAEPMAAPGSAGSDFSANAPPLSGLTLLATIPAAASPRRGYLIQAQCTAGLVVVFDRDIGGLDPTLIILAGAPVNGGQGGTLDMSGMPHTGKIEIYSGATDCQMAARAW